VTARAYYPGTYRGRRPEETWRIIAPQLSTFDITRVADVTRLDTIGIPVAVAVRPLARTLSVAQGKGTTWELARVSAAMEAIEFWHAEHACPAADSIAVPAARLRLPYQLAELDHEPGSLVTPATPLDWVTGRGVLTGATVPVPRAAVALAGVDGWRPAGLRVSTNGLAAGNAPAEAAVHGLYELAERDALHRDGASGGGYLELSTVDGHEADLVHRVLAAGAYLEVRRVPSRLGLACFRAIVWSEDFPVLALGSGAHLDATVALSRAITEAAQSRLTAISGARDDLARVYDVARSALVARPTPPAVLTPWSDLTGAAPGFDTFEAELTYLATLVRAATGREPVVVDLSTSADFAVVKMLGPGLGFAGDRHT
jgi:ribosomal protein S12 methylthiotransferase accessory factor